MEDFKQGDRVELDYRKYPHLAALMIKARDTIYGVVVRSYDGSENFTVRIDENTVSPPTIAKVAWKKRVATDDLSLVLCREHMVNLGLYSGLSPEEEEEVRERLEYGDF